MNLKLIFTCDMYIPSCGLHILILTWILKCDLIFITVCMQEQRVDEGIFINAGIELSLVSFSC